MIYNPFFKYAPHCLAKLWFTWFRMFLQKQITGVFRLFSDKGVQNRLDKFEIKSEKCVVTLIELKELILNILVPYLNLTISNMIHFHENVVFLKFSVVLLYEMIKSKNSVDHVTVAYQLSFYFQALQYTSTWVTNFVLRNMNYCKALQMKRIGEWKNNWSCYIFQRTDSNLNYSFFSF